jgi:large subunit ribosomal protein L23
MDLYHIIVKPLVTEKSTHQSRQKSAGGGGAYSFEVHPNASKSEIKDAVEKIYGVRVDKVRTSNQQGKLKRFRFRFGRTRKTKKAVVVLHADSHIDLF